MERESRRKGRTPREAPADRVWRRGRRVRRGAAVAAAAGGALLSACDRDPFVPDRAPTIEGLIVAMTGAAGPLDEGFMHVKTVPVEGDPCGIVFRVTRSTEIATRSRGTGRRGRTGDLRVGAFVRAWTFGGVAASCPGQAGADYVELDEDVDIEVPAIRTSASEYAVEPWDGGVRVTIPYVLANLTDDDQFVVNCRGSTALHVEKWIDDRWESVWAPPRFGCLGPPIVIAPGRSVARELEITAHPDCDCGEPAFLLDDPRGTYRIVLDAIVATYDDEAHTWGETLPLDMRVSNAFGIR